MSEATSIKPLFLGNFLSPTRGTLGPTETLIQYFRSDGWKVYSASGHESKILRALEILQAAATCPCNVICADVFSGNARNILPIVSNIARFRKLPLVLVLHGGQLPEVYEQHPATLRRLLAAAARIVTPSPGLKAFFESKGHAVEMIPNAIQPALFPYQAPVLESTSPRLLWIRAFSDIYRPKLAIDILKALQQSHPGATLTMVGPDAGNLPEIRQYLQQSGLEQAVRLSGPVPNHQLSQFHHGHSVLINTTAYESFGVSVLEAATSGIPIISTNVGSLPLLWQNDRDILLVDTADAAVFSEKIRLLLDHPDRARQLSENARLTAAQFTLQNIAPHWRDLFHELLG